ncbi:MAG: putative Ig domain-containing protein [Porticoccaceae bacterium]
MISGKASTEVKQGDYYIFTPFADDLDGDKLKFSISNKPDWLFFDSRASSLTGRPTNADVGISENIIISVFDSHQLKARLTPFDIKASGL